MFVRIKPSGPRSYLQVVENKRDGKKTRQRVIATLGRLDRLEAQGDIDSLAKSLARFSKKVRIVEGHRSGRLSAGAMRRIGPALVLEKLWKDLGLGRVIQAHLLHRKIASTSGARGYELARRAWHHTPGVGRGVGGYPSARRTLAGAAIPSAWSALPVAPTNSVLSQYRSFPSATSTSESASRSRFTSSHSNR